MQAVLKFPVIAMKGGVMSFHADERSLRSCTKAALKSGWFTGLKIVDSAGFEYEVRSAKYLRDSGRKLYPGWFAPKLIEVELELGEGRPRTVEELRKILRRAITSDRHFWESAWDVDLDEVLNRISRAESVTELSDLLVYLLTQRPSSGQRGRTRANDRSDR